MARNVYDDIDNPEPLLSKSDFLQYLVSLIYQRVVYKSRSIPSCKHFCILFINRKQYLNYSIYYEDPHSRREGCQLSVSFTNPVRSKILTLYSETVKGGVLGGVLGLALGGGAVVAASRRWPAFRGITVPFRAFIAVSTGTFSCKCLLQFAAV